MFTLPTRVRRARILVPMTQADMARRLGVQRSAVTQWEREGGTRPNVAHLAQIANETGVRFEWLATGRGPCQPAEGEFDLAVTVQDLARDHLESRLLESLRRLPYHRREKVVRVVELLSN